MQNKGSEWKQWDLHFHTQSSYDYGNKSVTNEDIIDEMKRNGISAFAITDHHVIDIARFRDLAKLGKAKGITVLPGIEFLSDAKGQAPIHFIAVFSENSDIEYIWAQIENRTAISKVRGEGKQLYEVYCDLEDTIKLIKDDLNGIVTIHAGKKSNSLENITNSLPHKVAQKMDAANLIDIFELGKESDQDDYRKYVFPALNKKIPMIICSDNHNINKYIRKQKLWIKGEPSFAGLKYALNEPEARFFIGEEPSVIKRVRENKTKYIKSLNIKRTGKHDSNSVWFEGLVIPLNSELVTIIGHKGSGKSALSDILAMCSDAEHSKDYIFLDKNKFKKKGLADRFSAWVEFESGGKTEERELIHSIDESQERLVRYLPQSYFEKVCNEIGKVDAFRQEIEKVVFQYVPSEDRMGKTSFDDLIGLKKSSANKEIHHINEQILQLNDEIIKIENETDPEFKKSLLSKKRIKEEELKVHNASKPLVLKDPSELTESEETKQKKIALNKFDSTKLEIEIEIDTLKKRISNRKILIIEADKLNRDLKNKHNDLVVAIADGQDISEKCGFDLSKVISSKFDENIIDSTIQELKILNNKDSELVSIEDDWASKDYDSLNLASKVERLKGEIKAIHSAFTGDQKAYQDYQDILSEWERKRIEIEGDVETVDSLSYINEKLIYLDTKLYDELNKLRESRISKSVEIFSKKSEIKSFYDEVKVEISNKLAESDVSGLSIASYFYYSNEFKNSLLRNVKQNKIGSFYGSEDGLTLLQEELILPTNWNDPVGVTRFLRKIIEYLEFDKRPNSKVGENTFIGGVTKDRKELYAYIFGLSFLEPFYDLQQRDKSLEQLSPGEKGALLLVFYLVLDKEEVPLVIDQPEDNLDNNSVAKVLVPYIKEAKKYRQIIMVTHNPNLAVVADSEQVINVNIDKENGNRFSFISGGIEHTVINEKIVEVLEGTIPAFTLRKDKYQIA